MGDCFLSEIALEKSRPDSLSGLLGRKYYSPLCQYELLLSKKLSPYFSLFTRVRSVFRGRDRILDDEPRDVRSEVGGSAYLDEGTRVMASASNEGDLMLGVSHSFFGDRLLYFWAKSKPLQALELESATVFSYNDLLVKVNILIYADQSSE